MSTQLPEGAVTVLFTDVEGSTDLRNRLGDEAADQLLRAHEDTVRELVARHGGHEVKALGDGFMVAFASPRKAISCAVEIQRSLEGRSRERPSHELRVRIGINTGEVSSKAGDLFGAAVNAAARIAAKARGGQILIAGVVKELAGVRPDLSYVDRGLYWLKGFPDRWRLFEVLRRAAGPVEELTAVSPGKTRFVGREKERADLRRFVERAADGHGTLVMIGGEPGVGKTRITEEMAEEAAAYQMIALVGHCSETEAAPPYAPVVEMLEATIRGISRETVREALGDSAPEIARILPELRRLFPDLPPPLQLPPEQERRYLFNCLTDFLERASRMVPLMLVLEDLHWADEPSLLLIQHLAERLHEMPLLVLGTYRDVELDVARPLARALEELTRRRLAHRVGLGRLPKDEVGEMLRALAGRDAPSSLADAVYNETEGNCFFVEEVFHHLNEEGKLFDAQGRWRTEVEVGEIDVPEGVRLVIGRRLERLSEGARRALAAAAVIGRSFPYELVEALGEVSVDELLDGIEEAQRARLVTSFEDPLRPRLEFAHELIRQTLLSGLALPRRQRLHLRVAEAIERVYARDIDTHVSDLAHHLYQAGAAADQKKTVHYLIQAGDRAMAAAAFEEALRAYERATATQTDEEPRARADLLMKLGFAHRSLGRTSESLASWREGLDAYAALGDPDAVARACWDISYQLGWAGRPIEGMEFVQRGLVALEDRRTLERGFLLASAGTFVGYLGDYEGGMAMNDEALDIAGELGDKALDGYARLSRCVVNYTYAEHATLVAEGPAVAETLRSAGSTYDLASLLTLLEWAYFAVGREEESAAVHAELDPLARRIGNTVALLLTSRGEAVRRFNETDGLDEYERFARHDLQVCLDAEFEWVANSFGFLWSVEFWRGNWDEALTQAQASLGVEPPGAFNGWSWGLVFLTLCYMGRRAEALEMFEAVRARLPVPGRPAPWGSSAILHCAVEGLAVLGEREPCAALYELIDTEPSALWFIRAYDRRLTATLAGIAAHQGGKWDEADRHFARALDQARSRGSLEQAEVRRFSAVMLLERNAAGDHDRARELLEEASERYGSIGMPRHIEMVEELLKKL